ncbi:MAG: hypothetical protein FWH08_04860 [Oscillospiraceae bacterium]|nr:hypothetical protein [Oscillospiraceae bacterium]
MNNININGFWVSYASYEQAKSVSENIHKNEKTSICGVLECIRQMMPDWNITTDTAPFNGRGARNVAINISVLNRMVESPDEMLKYIAYLLDAKSGIAAYESNYENKRGVQLIAHGSIIDADGNVTSWNINVTEERKAESRSIIHFPAINKQTWGEVMKKHFHRITDANHSGNLCVQT